MNENRAAIYVHIPFCRAKCAYCDFASFPNRQGDMDFYVEKLLLEAKSARERYEAFSVPSVFIGGGTPSILSGGLISKILDTLGTLFPIESGAEISIEGNPGTLTGQWLAAAKAAGANRLSLGAQAFQEELLRMLERIHTAAEIGEAVDMARAAGFDNLNIDLMYALPGQTEEMWRESLQSALALDVPHVSCYSLIAEEGTPLTRRIERGELTLPEDETVLNMQRMAADVLRKGGLMRYEISNYARAGFESRHNMGYWRRVDYLGLGCAAHSLMRGERFCNSPSLDGYFAGQIGLERETLSREDEMEEAVMLELRTVAGIDLKAFKARYGADFAQKYARGIRILCENGLAALDGCSFRLTDEGLDVQNAAVVELLG
ncbi:MAG: radical SAM family heme chaperone HemW [Clostridia bacterium]|nr:radical SAM family heme chaperone HemW [Clostridia bacterium]